MSIRVSRTDLLQVLARVEPGRSKRDFIDQSSCYVFTGGWCATYNDEICVRAKSGLPEDFAGAVHGTPLKNALENVPDDEVDLDPSERELRVRGRRARFGVRMEGEIRLPIENVAVPEKWSVLDNPPEFVAALRQVCGVAGTDEEQFVTVSVRLTPGWVEATDCWQAMRHTMQTGIDIPCMVRAKSLLPVCGFDIVKVGTTDDWVHFRNKNVLYSARRHLLDFPRPLDPLFEFRGAAATLPKGAVDAAKLAAVFSGEDKENDKVTVSLTEGRMVVRGDGAFGWGEVDLEVTYKGAPVAFRIGPDTLTKLVEKHSECEIGPDKLRVAGENWQYVACLWKPENTDQPKKKVVVIEPEESEEPGDDE